MAAIKSATCVGRHMKAVGDHSERSKPNTARDFRGHHEKGERNRSPGFALIRCLASAMKEMAVFTRGHGVLIFHDLSSAARAFIQNSSGLS